MQKLRSILSFGIKGYLAEIGWFVAHKHKSSVNGENEPIPWLTYSFIDFLENRLNKEQSVFEFGSGNSTRYFAKKVNHISSLEHDKAWYESGLKINLRMPILSSANLMKMVIIVGEQSTPNKNSI